MTDGNTGFHVAPITEEDMFKVRDILQRAADAIVGMSQLSADVYTLHQTVTSLQADTERLRSQNNALDEALNYSRKARDELSAKLDEVTRERDNYQSEYRLEKEGSDKMAMQAEKLEAQLVDARHERDDAQFQVLELKDKLAATEAKLAEVQSHIYDMNLLFQSKASTPEPPAEPITEPSPSAVSVPINEASPTEPAPKPDSVDHWEPGYVWDTTTMKYWREGVTPRADGEAIPF